MTDSISPDKLSYDDVLVDRILDAARVHNRQIQAPSFSKMQEDLSCRLATESRSYAGAPVARDRNGRGPSRLGIQIFATVCALAAAIGLFANTILNRTAPSVGVWTYSTGNGQRATLTLPDGSQVLLNVASRLEVPVDYERGNRALRLDGAALFTVVNRSRAPFSVIAGPGTVRVLGTRFFVRHYATDTAATISVHDGKVAVGSKVLTAEQQVAVSARGVSEIQAISTGPLDVMHGMLTFNQIPLPDAIAELNRWYDADIRLGDSVIAMQNVSGKFKSGSLTDLRAILSMMFDVKIVQEGRVLTLYSRD